MQYIKVRPLNAALGAEIFGVDISRPLAGQVVKEIRQAFLEHLVVFFRDQQLTPQQQLAFARQFGAPMAYPQLKGLADCPLVTPVIKLEHERNNFGGVWHTDTAYLDRPPMASLLYALQTPLHGGDTLFANQYLAYETLPANIRGELGELIAVNTSTKAEATRTREERQRDSGDQLQVLSAKHPAVRTHPETGRKSLYVNVGHTTHFDARSEQDSAELLAVLFAHQIRPEFTCRFHWQPGSLAFWDNRCTLHFPVNDYHGSRRVMHRVTLTGDKPS
ncbi:MAG: TauD/TfdA family dioxygenase [Betaproteobacteria bacterium]|nr:MAG: TauD/TfdA family dioxygenase [Betaproteobacteria bacterium]